jgi:peptidoglycan/xylan/chitin deacetylase (PgdA/CDA1 family)
MSIIPTIRSVGAFSPKSISGLQLWFKADKGLYQDAAMTTPAVADSDPVGAWQDQSGNGKHATQATAGYRPFLKLNIQNGRQVLRFDGSDDQLSFTALSLTDFTAYIVYKLTSITGAGKAYIIAGTSKGIYGGGVGSGVDGYGAYDGTNTREAALEEANTWGVVCVSNAYCDRNAAEAIYHDTGTLTSLHLSRIGQYPTYAGDDFTGDIAEILVYNTQHDAATRWKIERYLAIRWGIKLLGMGYSLPAAGLGLVLTFDDGYANMYPGFRYMQTRGLVATSYIVSDWIGAAGYLTSSQLQTMGAAGWVMGVHGKDHTDWKTLTQAQIETQISTCAGVLTGLGLTAGVKHAAYPYGGTPDADMLAAMAAQGMYTGRTTTSDPSTDPSTVTHYDFGVALSVTNTTTLANMQDAVTNAMSASGYCVMLIHGLLYFSSAAWHTTYPIFEAFIDWIVAQNIPCATMVDLYALM